MDTNPHTSFRFTPTIIGKQKAITEIYAEGEVSDCLSLAASS